MTVIFLIPLVLSAIATVWIVFDDDFDVIAKCIVFVVAALAVCFQFVPMLQASVHFAVPVFMQLILGGWWYFATQFE